MNESEKERLIKKDIASIENRVRHAFNQGYEMGLKERSSEIPNTCEDAVSSQAVLEIQAKYAEYVGTTKFWQMRDDVKALPPVSLQQRTGQWIAQDIHNCHTDFRCSECGYVYNFMHLYGKPTADYTYCPNCGCSMIEPQEGANEYV